MHNSRSDSDLFFKCSKPNCNATFDREYHLNRHLRVHNNDFEKCQYCPFKYYVPGDYQHHLNRHFGIKDFKCDQCGKLFISNLHLNKHYAMHGFKLDHCLLCDDYNASSKNSINNHMRKKHPRHVGSNVTWDSVQKFVKITK